MNVVNVVEAMDNSPSAYSAQLFTAAQACAEKFSEALMVECEIVFRVTVVPMIIETAVITRTDMRATKPFWNCFPLFIDSTNIYLLYHIWEFSPSLA